MNSNAIAEFSIKTKMGDVYDCQVLYVSLDKSMMSSNKKIIFECGNSEYCYIYSATATQGMAVVKKNSETICDGWKNTPEGYIMEEVGKELFSMMMLSMMPKTTNTKTIS